MTDTVTPPNTDDAVYEWAPPEPKKRRRLGLALGIGIPAAAIVIGAGIASALLVAPGTTVGGIPVGGLTASAAGDAIADRLAGFTVTVGDKALTGEQLGISTDAVAAGEAAHSERPLWALGSWNGEPLPLALTIDEEAATEVLRAAAPSLYSDPVDAGVSFDEKKGVYVASKASDGSGVDLEALTARVSDAIAAGETTIALDPAPATIPAAISTDAAGDVAKKLNDMIATAGFYVGEERTVELTPASFAELVTITPDDAAGTLAITANEAAVKKALDAAAKKINRDKVDEEVVTNSSGTVLKTIVEGKTGRTIGDTSGLSASFATQLAQGDAAFTLPVTEVAFDTKKLERLLEVDLSEQRLYMKENGKVVDSWLISSGTKSNPSTPGRFRIRAHVDNQYMGSCDPGDTTYDYCVRDVKFVMYYNGDQAFHGVWWHHNWGTPMSHGCVGMREDLAQKIYWWAMVGTDVYVHA